MCAGGEGRDVCQVIVIIVSNHEYFAKKFLLDRALVARPFWSPRMVSQIKSASCHLAQRIVEA